MKNRFAIKAVFFFFGPFLPIRGGCHCGIEHPRWLTRAHRVNLLWLQLLALIGIPWATPTPTLLSLTAGVTLVMVFGVSAGYHRYFSHHSFKCGPVFEIVLGAMGAAACQLGPIWWASKHRHHHRSSDTVADIHTPVHYGLFRAQIGWLLEPLNYFVDSRNVSDLVGRPWLRRLEIYWFLVPLTLAALLGAGGALSGAGSARLVYWGFLLPVLLSSHATYTINSLAHRFGSSPYDTNDQSRNNLLVAILTLGDGWHNNHHAFPGSARHGFHWWQVDVAYWVLRLLERIGLVRDLRPPPPAAFSAPTRPAPT